MAASIDAKLVVRFRSASPWFVDPLFGRRSPGGEKAPACPSCVRTAAWTTDKDGLIPDLLAAEITAKTGKNPAQLHQEQVERFGESWYKRVDTPTTSSRSRRPSSRTGDDVEATQLAGEDITAKLTEAPGNHAKIGGLKVTTRTTVRRPSVRHREHLQRCTPRAVNPLEALDKVTCRGHRGRGQGSGRVIRRSASNQGVARKDPFRMERVFFVVDIRRMARNVLFWHETQSSAAPCISLSRYA